jgi:dimethylamine monooxygenase subunit A
VHELRLSPEGPPWLSMGTARTSDWLTPLADDSVKRRLLEQARDAVLVAEAPELLGPLERAALRVEEDLCILRDGRLVAGCVCSPSHWRLRDKVGRPVAEIHQRVPGYASELADKVDAFLQRLPAGTVVARRNFTIHELADLFAPEPPATMGVPPAEQWLRSERQTLRRFDRSGAVLFTIRTQQIQLENLPADVRTKLAARLRAEPADLIAYRSLTDRLPALIDWLAS